MKEDHIARLIAELKDDDNEDAARKAGVTLGNLGADSIPALVEAFQDKSWDKRHRAIYVLGHCGKAAQAHLYKILRESKGLCQRQAMFGIRRIGGYNSKTIAHLSPYLKSPDAVVRECSEQILLEINTTESLLKLLRSNPKLQTKITHGFLKLGPNCNPALIKLLSSKSRGERELATQVLARQGQSATQQLRERLQDSNRNTALLALQLLVSFGKDSKLQWADLQPGLESIRLKEQCLAISALTLIDGPDREINETLRVKLRSISLELRCVAALTLIQRTGRISETCEDIIRAGLEFGDPQVQSMILIGIPQLPTRPDKLFSSLTALLKAPQEGIRLHTLRCLSQFSSQLQSQRSFLIQSLHDEVSPRVKALYLDRLSPLDLTGVEDPTKWLTLLKGSTAEIQQKTLFCLAKMRPLDGGSHDAVAQCLRSENLFVKQNAIVLLTRWKTTAPDILRQIIACLGHPRREIRNLAGQALLERSSAAIPVMRECLKTAQDREKGNLISLLGRLKDKASRPAIEACLFAKEPMLRLNALFAVSGLKKPSPKAGQQILVLAESDSILAIRQVATRLKQEFGLKKTLESQIAGLLAQFQSTDAIVRYQALTRLVKHGEKAIPALIKELANADANVRYHCASALGLLADKASKAIPALSNSLKDSDPRVREAARKALSQILQINK